MFRQAGTVQLYSWLKWGPVIEHRKSFLPLNFDPPNQTLIFFVTVDVRCSYGPIYTVRLCCMRQAYDRLTTRIVSCKSKLHESSHVVGLS